MTAGQAFGTVVKKRRLELQISQEKLAELTDLHRTYISQIERGVKSPSLNVLVALGNAFQTPTHVLIAEMEEVLNAKH